MKIEEFLARKAELQLQLDQVSGQITAVRNEVLKEIGAAIDQFGISLIEIKQFFSAPVIEQSPAAKQKGGAKVIDRKLYVYYDKENDRWFNGHTPIPKWLDLSRADYYLVPGKKHTNKVLAAIEAKTEIKTIKLAPKKSK